MSSRPPWRKPWALGCICSGRCQLVPFPFNFFVTFLSFATFLLARRAHDAKAELAGTRQGYERERVELEALRTENSRLQRELARATSLAQNPVRWKVERRSMMHAQ